MKEPIREVVPVEELPDEELVSAHRRGDGRAMDALLLRYRNFARNKARQYFLAGADREDVVQEAMIGLYKAVRDFDLDRQTSFRAFADVCITRQVITAVKMATRQKHIPLNTYVSFSKPIASDDEDRALLDVLRSPQSPDPADVVIWGEELRKMKLAFAEILSEFEVEVLHLYVEGKSYQEIAELLGRHAKSVDNAIQRIKRKVELHLRSRDQGPASPGARARSVTG